MIDESKIAERYLEIGPELNERQRRLWAASEARACGRGGIAAVVRATGIGKNTVVRGIAELQEGTRLDSGRVRRPGAGRPRLTDSDPELVGALEALVDPDTRGDPCSPLRWSSKSLGKLAGALCAAGHQISDRTTGKLLRGLGFRLHANQKTREGKDHPDRDAQFAHINETTRAALEAGEPTISIDTKKRELVGDFKAVGREYEPTGRPVEVRTHDFKDKDLGHAIPYGVYDIKLNEGMMSVGVTNDTSAFAVNSIRAWWAHLGRKRYPDATVLTITADGGGSNSSRTRLWKVELQKLVDELGLAIRVCHFPPGTSKWNKIEHRMFSFVTLNWRGKPLESLEVIIDLISSTTTSTGLEVHARLDPGHYEKGIKVSDQELAAVNIERHPFHPDWNYTIHPSPTDPLI
ncbi:MAG: ISAzo13 family transposase, partial [Actinomycetota bacterium]|nr:ISAzo13 family transposase [Actinomycetota bacterium]